MFVVVSNEFAEDRFELAAMEDQYPVETLASCGADEPLGEHVCPRSSDGRADDPNAPGSEHLVEAGGELGVSVPDQERGRAGLFGQDEAQIASLLGDPLPRDGGDAAYVDTPGVELDEEEHVETAKQHRVDVEELTCQHRWRPGTQELRPRHTRAFRRWLDAVTAQDRQFMTEYDDLDGQFVLFPPAKPEQLEQAYQRHVRKDNAIAHYCQPSAPGESSRGWLGWGFRHPQETAGLSGLPLVSLFTLFEAGAQIIAGFCGRR